MARESDPYAELGVPRDATQTEITHAFRQLLRLHHPDTRQVDGTTSVEDSESTLRRVIAAYAEVGEYRPHAERRREPPTPLVTLPTRSRSTGPAIEDAIRAGPIRWSRKS